MLLKGRLPESLSGVPDRTYHAILTDPPFGLSPDLDRPGVAEAVLSVWLAELQGEEACERARSRFPRSGMLGRAWDNLPPDPLTWRELLRVTRPGGLCFAYSHAKVYGLMEMGLRLAGWEILPFFVRIHGGAMALGMDVSKAIDKAAGAEREVVAESPHSANRAASSVQADPSSPHGFVGRPEGRRMITAAATPLASTFDGYATAVKNACDPIIVARRPPDGTWAENAERWGVGGFNVGAGKIPSSEKTPFPAGHDSARGGYARGSMTRPREADPNPAGRYPSNVLFEHLEGCKPTVCLDGCPVAELGEQSGERKGGGATHDKKSTPRNAYGSYARVADRPAMDDAGTAARFFYQARASRAERHRGAEHLLWARDPSHPDGWRLVDAAEYEAIGERCGAEAMKTERYAKMMAEGYMESPRAAVAARGVYGGSCQSGDRQIAPSPDLARKDAQRYLDAARESERTRGNCHLAVKPVDLGSQLARLALQPVVDGEKPRLLVPWSGSGSEVIAAVLAGWDPEAIDTAEMSNQWPVVAEARLRWWTGVIEKLRGSVIGDYASALDVLRAMGTGEDPEPEEDAPQLSLF